MYSVFIKGFTQIDSTSTTLHTGETRLFVYTGKVELEVERKFVYRKRHSGRLISIGNLGLSPEKSVSSLHCRTKICELLNSTRSLGGVVNKNKTSRLIVSRVYHHSELFSTVYLY